MDPEKPSKTPRKVKFAPRAPASRKSKATTAKTEIDEESGEAQGLLRRMNENLARRGPKAQTKASVQVAFGPGASSSPSLRTFGVNKSVDSDKSSVSASEVSAIEQSDVCMVDSSDDEYKEPWDYQNSYYPTTLPMRKPYSGDPELLDAEEFGEDATNKEYDENTVNSAAELLGESEQGKMILFKFPPLPLFKQSVSRKGKEKEKVGVSTASQGSSKGGVQDLPGGYMGKMLVYKSGAIKLKLGETLFDVSPGSKCVVPQDVIAMNTAEKQCCVIGKIGKKAVVTPDINSIDLNSDRFG